MRAREFFELARATFLGLGLVASASHARDGSMRMRCAAIRRRRRRCPLLLGGDTELFCAALVEELARLERALDVDGASGGAVSVRWCADAMRMRPWGWGCAVAVAVAPELEPWRRSLSLIHGRFPRRATVAEREVSVAVQDLNTGSQTDGGAGHGGQGRDERVRAPVELLRPRSVELREGVELFDSVIDQVFDEVIRGRNEMLAILRDKALP